MGQTAEWHEVIESLATSIVRISTPTGSGTGFLFSVTKARPQKMIAIATAAHVVDHAHYWEQPIRIIHPTSGKSKIIRPSERAILLDPSRDSAALLFDQDDIPLPDTAPGLLAQGKYVKPGVEVGWLGFPGLANAGLSFFSGRISSFIQPDEQYMPESYLVDGVAINGVSGGPAFRNIGGEMEILGVVSAYLANRNTGETLPGVAVIRTVYQFHDVINQLRTLEEAQEKEATQPPPEPPRQTGANDGSAPSGLIR
jgi:hypothetical protein